MRARLGLYWGPCLHPAPTYSESKSDRSCASNFEQNIGGEMCLYPDRTQEPIILAEDVASLNNLCAKLQICSLNEIPGQLWATHDMFLGEAA